MKVIIAACAILATGPAYSVQLGACRATIEAIHAETNEMDPVEIVWLSKSLDRIHQVCLQEIDELRATVLSDGPNAPSPTITTCQNIGGGMLSCTTN